MVSYEVYSAAAELWTVVVVCAVAVSLNGRVVVRISWVDFTTEWADPHCSLLNPPDERVDVGSALLAPDNGIILEGHRGHFFSL